MCATQILNEPWTISYDRKEVFLSVVVRVRNAAGFIRPALERLINVMEQNFNFYEIVLIDDASTTPPGPS